MTTVTLKIVTSIIVKAKYVTSRQKRLCYAAPFVANFNEEDMDRFMFHLKKGKLKLTKVALERKRLHFDREIFDEKMECWEPSKPIVYDSVNKLAASFEKNVNRKKTVKNAKIKIFLGWINLNFLWIHSFSIMISNCIFSLMQQV